MKKWAGKILLIGGIAFLLCLALLWLTVPIMITGKISESETKYAQQVELMKRKAEEAKGKSAPMKESN